MENSLPSLSPQENYRRFLDVFAEEVDRRHPGVFEWRFGKPFPHAADGLIITKADVGGYVFVVGVATWPGAIQGGVWREDALHSYSAGILKYRDWEHPDLHHLDNVHLEGRSSLDPSKILDWMVRDWAYERPWIAPAPVNPPTEKKRLQQLVRGLATRADVPVLLNVKIRAKHQLTPAAITALKADLKALRLEQIRDCFPSDKRGALALGTTVLLRGYETQSPPGRDPMLCLTAVGPLRRSDAQEIRMRLEVLNTVNQNHRWEQECWRWHADSAEADAGTRWGAPVPVDALAAGSLSVTRLNELVEQKRATDGEKAALAILLQDEGRLLEAIELYGVEIDDKLKRLCGGQKIYPPACCASADEKWVERLQDWMRSCAPWLLENATLREAERISAWAEGKRGRKRRLPVLKLLIFPGQRHQRKASLMLTAKLDGTCPRLEIQATASNARLHESAWKRPLEIDLARYELR